jgi:pimeloyl-ACP methyl ester carboxylesterase
MAIGYEVLGSGPYKILVLHGWFGDHSLWSPLYPLIDREKFSYAFMDSRGYGASRGIAGTHTIDEISADAIALTEELGWQRFAVVGHAMGAMAAQRVAIDAGTRVMAIIAVSPIPASGTDFAGAKDALFRRAATDDAAAREIIGDALGGPVPGQGSDSRAVMVDRILKHARASSEPAAFADYYAAFNATDFSADAASLKAPMLLLLGAHDASVTRNSIRAHFSPLYPHAELDLLPHCGHYPMIEQPALLVQKIERYLSGRATV